MPVLSKAGSCKTSRILPKFLEYRYEKVQRCFFHSDFKVALGRNSCSRQVGFSQSAAMGQVLGNLTEIYNETMNSGIDLYDLQFIQNLIFQVLFVNVRHAVSFGASWFIGIPNVGL